MSRVPSVIPMIASVESFDFGVGGVGGVGYGVGNGVGYGVGVGGSVGGGGVGKQSLFVVHKQRFDSSAPSDFS